jgi:hypothetical protein
VIDDDILRFDVSVHDADAMGIMKSFEDLIDIKFAIFGGQYLK